MGRARLRRRRRVARGRPGQGARLFGHSKATWAGSGAYVVLGALAAYGLGHGVEALGAGPGAIETGAAPDLARCALAALAAAASDLVPVPPDDNMPGALAAGVALRLTRGI